MTNKKNFDNSFIIDDPDFSIENFIKGLQNKFSFILETPIKTIQLYLDTFDWRLYNKGLVFVKAPGGYKLKDINEVKILSSIPLKTKKNIKNWQDFPKSTLKNQLKTALDIRALIPWINVEKHTQSLRILNKDDKTVLKLQLQKIYLIQGKSKTFIHHTITLQPVRGYKTELKDIRKYLKELGLSNLTTNIFSLGLEKIGEVPGKYTSKIKVVLNPQMSAQEAGVVIFKNLLSTMRINEEGIKKDIDIEFLHDFRVAIRRTRSALSQIKDIFPKEETDKFKKDFSKLGKISNKLRDLDVYLLTREKYKKMLAEDLHEGLDLIFNIVEAERNKEQRRVVKALNSSEYHKILKSWEDYLNSEKEKALNSEKPIYELAKEFIWKKYKKIIKTGSKIDDNTPDEELHSLRIECKKLRYLLEFFTSLFPEDEISFIVKHFKKLQDNLGDFNDLCIQQESLKNMVKEFKVKEEDILKISMSIGGLISVLNQKQNEVRKDFEKSFNEISNKEYVKIFNKLFSPNQS